MPLVSQSLSGEASLEACLVNDAAHIQQGDQGLGVGLIQAALMCLLPPDLFSVDPAEMDAWSFGPTTAASVLAYKRRHDVVNRAYQNAPDAIVGKMTIRSLDTGMAGWEAGQKWQAENPSEPTLSATVRGLRERMA